MLTPTIAAVATAAGPGAIGIVRVSGPLVPHIVRSIAHYLPEPRAVSLQAFRSSDRQAIDSGFVIYFKAPHSYTGEDLAEFHAHGGQLILAKLLKAMYSAGAIPARPGEFSERAFLNGKLDLLQAEAVADMINAASDRALNAAQNAMKGLFSNRIKIIADRIIAVRATLEATIDFADDLQDSQQAAALFTEISLLREMIALLQKNATDGAVLARGINTVIVGKPNTGKSTLLNRLAGVDRAIVSAEPGTTRDVLHTEINLNGLVLSVQDTAGIHHTTNEIEKEGIRRALSAAANADLILEVHDAAAFDDGIANIPAGVTTRKIIKVMNKIDLTNEQPSVTNMQGTPVVRLSAATGVGVDLLHESILGAVGLAEESNNLFLARERHLSALDRAITALDFESAQALSEAPELSAERLRLAHRALGEIIGEFTSEDLLGTIFSRFCIGK